MTQALNSHLINRCTECGSHMISISTGEVCSACGLMSEEPKYENHFHMGYNPNYKSTGQFAFPLENRGSRIYTRKQDNLTSQQLSKAKRLTSVNNWKNISNVKDVAISSILKDIVVKLEIESLYEMIWYDYKKISKNEDIHNHITLVATLIYIKCRKTKKPIELKVIIALFQKLGHRVNVKLIVRDILNFNLRSKPFEFEKYLPKYISQILNSKEMQKRMKRALISETQMQKILETPVRVQRQIEEYRRFNPTTLAATILYARVKSHPIMSSNPRLITQSVIADIVQSNEISLRELWINQIKPYLF